MVRKAARRIVFGYAAIATVWVFVTDTILIKIWSDVQDVYIFGVIKALLFILLSTGALYCLMRGVLRRETRDKEALRARETLLGLFVEHAPAAIAMFDRDMRYLHVSRRWRTDYRLGDMPVRGRSHYDVFPQIPEARRAAHRRALAGEVVRAERDRFEHDGVAHWVCWEVRPWHSLDGTIGGVVLLVEEITKHVQAEEALREETLRMQTAVRAGEVGLWSYDLRSGKVHWSRELMRHLGYEDHEIVASFDEWEARLHPDDRERVLHAVRMFRDGTAPTYRIEYRLRHRDGTYRWTLSQASLIRDDDGNAIRMMGSHVDVTDRKRIEDELAHARKMEAIGSLSGSLAHDFNNHLAVIMGNLDLLKEHVAGDADAARFVEQALRGTIRSAELTRNLLAFSRRQPLNPSIVDAYARLAASARVIEHVLGDRVKFQLLPTPQPTTVCVDAAQFDSAVVNLVENARDAMPNGGSLTVSIRNLRLDRVPEMQSGEFVAIEIADTGAGMRPEVIGRAFEPFFTTKAAGHGVGLGLSMVYGFVRQSGGHVAIESAVGRGTTVRIFLPRASEEAMNVAAAPTLSAADAEGRGGTETILLVDDNDDVRRAAAAQLFSLGYRIVEAANGDAAMKILDQSEGRFDLLFTDVVMPGMDGQELARQAIRKQPDLKVLFASGFVGHEMSDEPPHPHRRLTKPYRKADLARAVRDTLDS